jgi:hypothetical protein
MVGAVLAAIVLTLLLPADLRLGPSWVLPLLEGVLLVTLIVADPGSITRRSRELRVVGIALVAVLGLSAMVATGLLIDSLITGGPETESAGELLQAGAIVWISNNIAFSLLYWELDCGGAAARAHDPERPPTSRFHSCSRRIFRRRVGGRALSTTYTSGSRTRLPSVRRTRCH